jgi:hypothetical protein
VGCYRAVGEGLELKIIFWASSLGEVQIELGRHFGQKVRLIKEERSIFEQWQVRSAERIFIPRAWTYQVMYRDGCIFSGLFSLGLGD